MTFSRHPPDGLSRADAVGSQSFVLPYPSSPTLGNVRGSDRGSTIETPMSDSFPNKVRVTPFALPRLSLDEREEIGVEHVSIHREHAV